MYCMHCGTKNPDTAKYCNNCGKSMNSAPSPKPAGGFFKRALVTLVAFGIFYGIGYVISSKPSEEKAAAGKDTGIVSDLVQPKPEVVVQTEPEGYIANLGGSWEQVKLRDGNFNLNVSALSFTETVYNCKEFTVNMDVTMNAGTHCKDWQVWGRTGGKFKKIGKVYLPNGDGYVSQTLTFVNPVTFDAIAITPTIVGGYSWSMGLSITDVYTS